MKKIIVCSLLVLGFLLQPIVVSANQTPPSLPERGGERVRTSGRVPHVQIGVKLVKEVHEELHRRSAALPDVITKRSFSPGATALWLDEDISLANPQVMVSGREFAHIHPDGSLHLPLPLNRALELTKKGWGERHPWHTRKNWDGFVMLYTPQNMKELETTWQLIVESYNFVTGRTIETSASKK